MIDFILMFLMGFTVALTGALVPGPLLVYTLKKTVESGPKTGFIVINGHVLVESAIIALMALGLTGFVGNILLQNALNVVGGVGLVYFGFKSIKLETVGSVEIEKNSLVCGGVFFTLFNPTFLPWWITVGASLVYYSLNSAGWWGVAALMAGHWVADYSVYGAVSVLGEKSKPFLGSGKHLEVMKALGGVLILFGLFFLFKAAAAMI